MGLGFKGCGFRVDVFMVQGFGLGFIKCSILRAMHHVPHFPLFTWPCMVDSRFLTLNTRP